VDMCVQVMELYKAGRLVFKGKPEEHPGQLVFSPDNVHPYSQTGHKLYTEALARSLSQMAGSTAAASQRLPSPMSPDRLEHVRMVPADQLVKTGEWTIVQPSKEAAGILSPEPFPVLMKTTSPGSTLVITFDGTMVGLYDVIGPGSGSWEVWLDGKRDTVFTRFDAFATYWRPHYVLLTGLTPGRHTVEFRLSAEAPDKKTLLGANAGDYMANPDKYRENAGYVGDLLLAGELVK
jgi:hypothetical protein